MQAQSEREGRMVHSVLTPLRAKTLKTDLVQELHIQCTILPQSNLGICSRWNGIIPLILHLLQRVVRKDSQSLLSLQFSPDRELNTDKMQYQSRRIKRNMALCKKTSPSTS